MINEASSPRFHRPLVEGEVAAEAFVPRDRTGSRAVFTPFGGAIAEISSFPHYNDCLHCKNDLKPVEARWGTGLCDACYSKCERECTSCGNELALQQLHWTSGLCDECYDKRTKECIKCHARLSYQRLLSSSVECEGCSTPIQASPDDTLLLARSPRMLTRTSSRIHSFDTGVKVAIASQFIFYLAPTMLLPSLYIEIESSEALSSHSAAASYSFVLMTCTVVAMAAPVPLGAWAEKRGEREVYAGVTLVATLAGLLLAYSPNVYVFALSWGLLSAPVALRGVRYAYFARCVNPDDLSAAGMLSSAAGLLGSLLGPVCAALAHNSFFWAAITASAAHAICALGLASWLPSRSMDRRRDHDGGEAKEQVCEKCGARLTEIEKPYGTHLCNQVVTCTSLFLSLLPSSSFPPPSSLDPLPPSSLPPFSSHLPPPTSRFPPPSVPLLTFPLAPSLSAPFLSISLPPLTHTFACA